MLQHIAPSVLLVVLTVGIEITHESNTSKTTKNKYSMPLKKSRSKVFRFLTNETSCNAHANMLMCLLTTFDPTLIQ